MWRLAHNYLPYLSREFWEVLDIHKRDTLGKMRIRSWFVALYSVCTQQHVFFFFLGAKESVDRWEMCIVTTQKYFRLAMGSIYSKNNVALKDTRNGVSFIFSTVRHSSFLFLMAEEGKQTLNVRRFKGFSFVCLCYWPSNNVHHQRRVPHSLTTCLCSICPFFFLPCSLYNVGGVDLRGAQERSDQQLGEQCSLQSLPEVESSWKGNQLQSHLSLHYCVSSSAHNDQRLVDELERVH